MTSRLAQEADSVKIANKAAVRPMEEDLRRAIMESQ